MCLGHRAEAIKNYFLNYNECASNDFVLSGGGKKVELLNSDIHDWRITFADTGIDSNIGQRLKAVEKYLEGEEEFLANYSDGLTDLPLPSNWSIFTNRAKSPAFLRPPEPQLSPGFAAERATAAWFQKSMPSTMAASAINGGYFHLQEEDIRLHRRERGTGHRAVSALIKEKQLIGYPYDGFWASMDTFKDKQQLEGLYARGAAPWEVWKTNGKK